jgi:catechol 2,3-dioxygenase-like lactoylglutathione lyase family enzyme
VLDHIYIGVSDLERSAAFYADALEPHGMAEVFRRPGDVAFGSAADRDSSSARAGAAKPVHVAFEAPDRPTVDRFHAAALAAGGRDNGGTGARGNTIRPITARSCSTPTATTSRPVCHR